MYLHPSAAKQTGGCSSSLISLSLGRHALLCDLMRFIICGWRPFRKGNPGRTGFAPAFNAEARRRMKILNLCVFASLRYNAVSDGGIRNRLGCRLPRMLGMRMPRISVVIPTLRGFEPELLDMLRGQTRPPDEIVPLTDGEAAGRLAAAAEVQLHTLQAGIGRRS